MNLPELYPYAAAATIGSFLDCWLCCCTVKHVSSAASAFCVSNLRLC